MKGKTGYRGGGVARKGMGAALKGGGMARKGVGVALKDGGKAKKMATGGSALGPAVGPGTGVGSIAVKPIPGRMPAFPGRPGGRPIGAGEPGRGAGFGNIPTVGTPGSPFTGNMYSPMTKPVLGGKPMAYAKGGAVKMTAGAGSGSGRLEKVAAHKASPRVKAVGLKKGGKVKMDVEELREFKGGKYMGGPKEEAAEKKKGKK